MKALVGIKLHQRPEKIQLHNVAYDFALLKEDLQRWFGKLPLKKLVIVHRLFCMIVMQTINVRQSILSMHY